MIRINLLGVERQKVKKAAAAMPSFDIGQRLTLLCSLILVASLLGIGWWGWTLNTTGTELDAEIARSQREAQQLRSLLNEVKTFDDRRNQLQQRVQLIEQLRGGQSIPVQLLDHVSRSLPDMLWLTEMDQENGAVTIQGRSTTLIALSDFVGNLGSTPLLQKPIEIVNSQVEAQAGSAQKGQPPIETIKFTVRAQMAGAAAPPAKGARGAGAAAAAPAAGRK